MGGLRVDFQTMTDRPRVSRDELGSIPLFRGFTDEQLDKLLALFQPAATHEGVLFKAGDRAEMFYLLTRGEVILTQDGVETHHLHPLVVIGELGAICGLARTTSATPAPDSEVWQVEAKALQTLFDQDKDLGLRFQRNLLDTVSDKVQRDQVRLNDMRANIIHTQKAMKRMRDFLLESKDTVVSNPLHEVIDGLIKRNRRVNYRVSPPAALQATLRLDDGTEAPVVQISRTDLTIEGAGGVEGERISGVLHLSGPEIPISGKILTVADDRVDVRLDLLMDEYAALLEGYLNRGQMLDFLV